MGKDTHSNFILYNWIDTLKIISKITENIFLDDTYEVVTIIQIWHNFKILIGKFHSMESIQIILSNL